MRSSSRRSFGQVVRHVFSAMRIGAARASTGGRERGCGPPAVVDGPQVQDVFHVAPAALDLQQLLVAQRDVLGREVGVAGAEQVFAVEVLLV